MKYDKCGGLNVLAIFKAAVELGLETPLVGVICAAENMISGKAYRPDDILTSLSGKTIEIVTTDAEGRLILADGLTYAQKNFNPRAVIDMATLTGGVVTRAGTRACRTILQRRHPGRTVIPGRRGNPRAAMAHAAG